MTNGIWRRLAIAALLAALSAPRLAIPTNLHDGFVELTAKDGSGLMISITVKTLEVPSGFLYARGYRWGGDQMKPPKSIIESINVTVGGEEIYLPLSAYVDLGNPARASVVSTVTGFELIITGGDAGGAYDAKFVFDQRWLLRRRVASREFPSEAWEETVYAFNRSEK